MDSRKNIKCLIVAYVAVNPLCDGVVCQSQQIFDRFERHYLHLNFDKDYYGVGENDVHKVLWSFMDATTIS